ncbi:MAG: hypothetical protein F4164_03385 [Gemmatimonadales bacterium]|nr:hypothetical protein [Gemmatimonadales bacterium]MYG48421.1 hypothetical protein [Gemmatimonadales bacterium]MYK00365.1 hypothetical protein [Candidatus Palauibacter ramosifaciens]
MTTETVSALAPADVLAATRDFFIGDDRMVDAWVDTESNTHIAFCTFRGNLSVAAFPDPAAPAGTRVRVTTLREEGIVPRLLAYLALAKARP